MKKIKQCSIVLSLLVLTSLMALLLTGCDSEETKQAKEEFNNEVARVQTDYESLNAEIAIAEELVMTEEAALDESLKPALENVISDAKTVEFNAPNMPSKTEDINAATDELKDVSFSEKVQSLQDAEKALSDSIEQLKLVTNPSEAFVIERLQGIEGVGEIGAITEDTDRNGLLGKDGSYVVKVNFISPWIDQSEVSGATAAEKGVSGGGGVEVFLTPEDVEKRDTYLGAFDGSLLSSGSHKVVGTVLVRTSDKLTASQQDALEAAIIESLTRLS